MSNKMLWKRLLATGMSMAMAATLFATNSITTFAEGSVSELAVTVEEGWAKLEPAPSDGEDIPIPGEDKQSWEPENLPQPEFDQEKSDPEVVATYETEDGDYKLEIVEVTNTIDTYKSDMDSHDEEGNQTDDYDWVSKEDTEGQTLDYTDAKTIVTMGDVSVRLETEDGEVTTALNQKGEEVPLELPVGIKFDDLEEVQVITKNDGSIHEINSWDTFCNPLVYGYFDKDGKFVEVGEDEKDNEGVQAYYVNRDWDVDRNGEPIYTVADTRYYTKDKDGQIVYLTEEQYLAVQGKSTVLTAKKEYDYNGQTYSEDELKEAQNIKKVGDWSYEVKGDKKGNTQTVEPEDVGFGEETVSVRVTKVKVIGEGYEKDGKTYYPVEYFFRYKNENYVVEGEQAFGRPQKVGNEYPENFSKDITSKDEIVHRVVDTTKKHTEKTVYYRIYDNNTNEVILELDEIAYRNLDSDNVSIVGDKVSVLDKNRKPVYIEKDDYDIITQVEVVTTVSTVNYYTVQDKYEKDDPMVVDVTIDGQTYQLAVEFWENDRIGATAVELVDNPKGGVDVVVHYAYSKYKNIPWAEQEIGEDTIVQNVNAGTFGIDGKATMKVKFTPAYNRTNVPKMPEVVELPEQEIRDMPSYAKAVLRDTNLADGAAVVRLLADALDESEEVILDPIYAAQTDYKPIDLFNRWFFLRPEVEVGEPDVDFEALRPTPEEEPTPTRERAPWITTAAIEETPVALAATVAPAGQVLGAQREEATGEAPAVLGASRARGTADETTAPFVRVLVMAAVASIALFLTRKREEEN